jgi:Xaa-Pro aminopeptidase
MICAITRVVHFDELPVDLKRRHDAVVRVDAEIMAATTPGAKAHDIFDKAQQAYGENGYPGEWKLHHQGGATGYMGREWIATPSCEETVMTNQPFAWNPSICGTKSEDTILATAQGVQPITGPCEDWPVVDVQVDGLTFRRPGILVK